MKNQLQPELTEEQWSFLGVLNALGGRSPVELLVSLVPLLPVPLFDLLKKAENAGWIRRQSDYELVMADSLPKSVSNKLKKIINKRQLTAIIDKIFKEQLSKNIDPSLMVSLLVKVDRHKDAGKLEIEIGKQLIEEKKLVEARPILEKSLKRLHDRCDDDETSEFYINCALEYSNLCFFLGQGFQENHHYLHKAHSLAEKRGDRRSHGLLNLHFGRLFYFTGMREKAIVAFSIGFEEVRDLNDEDIQSRSSGFLGIYFFMQGRYKEAVYQFERAVQNLETDENHIPAVPLAPMFLGYCNIYLGQFHRAIGVTDYHWRMATERSDFSAAVIYRVVLGTVLILLKKYENGEAHLNEGLDEAIQQDNALARYFCRGSLAYSYFSKGDVETGYEFMTQTVIDGRQSGLIRQFSSPFVLEMLHGFHQQGLAAIPGFEYQDFIERYCPDIADRYWKEINIHIQGVAMRLKALDRLGLGESREVVRDELLTSEEYLVRTGDSVQLAKTLLERARLELVDGNRQIARTLAQKAWREFGGYAEEFFPDDFRNILEEDGFPSNTSQYRKDFLKRYLEVLESIIPDREKAELLTKTISSSNQLFSAERGGLFWFEGNQSAQNPKLMAACNLSQEHVEAEDFHSYLNLVLPAFKANKPLLVKPNHQRVTKTDPMNRAVICIPVEIQGEVQCVLYHDTSYMTEAFDFLDASIMAQIGRQYSLIIERLMDYMKTEKQNHILNSNKPIHFDHFDQDTIITRSKKMEKLLAESEQVAHSDSAVLILGESGTGKELLAERIHTTSQVAEGPMIIVDATTIPENLFESELFGHEKGAFTGADRRKTGYIELANEGTLFLDEIGELPLSIQTKLLRTLQKKTFSRVGGTQIIKSNFRLVTATNRDLAHEVSEGRFREDLYYRLNVVPLTLPPLRERGNDSVWLAQKFLELFSRKHARNNLELTDKDKASISKYKWPGNIRELKNTMERAVILSKDQNIELILPEQKAPDVSNPFDDKPTLDEIQRRYITFIAKSTNGKISGPGGAAEILGMKRSSLYSRMKTLGMRS